MPLPCCSHGHYARKPCRVVSSSPRFHLPRQSLDLFVCRLHFRQIRSRSWLHQFLPQSRRNNGDKTKTAPLFVGGVVLILYLVPVDDAHQPYQALSRGESHGALPRRWLPISHWGTAFPRRCLTLSNRFRKHQSCSRWLLRSKHSKTAILKVLECLTK